jgi:ribosomal protein S18 acetylase RimI-like enzyme
MFGDQKEPRAMDISELDNPAWAALNGRHAALAIGDGPVRRYPAEVSPFAAIAGNDALPVLAERMTPGDVAVLWSPVALEAPEGVDLLMRFDCLQMVAFDFRPADVVDDADILGLKDAQEMQDLTILTKPGPFGLRTPDMGHYIGVHAEGRLVAMSGERMKPAGFTEISAVCVHPDHLGRGHARKLMSIVGKRIVADGRVPFLNVLPENTGAIKLYESLGFVPRHMMQVHLLQKPGGEGRTDSFFSSLE